MYVHQHDGAVDYGVVVKAATLTGESSSQFHHPLRTSRVALCRIVHSRAPTPQVSCAKSAAVDELTTNIDQQQVCADAAQLSVDIAGIDEVVAEETSERKEEKAMNAATLANAQGAIAAGLHRELSGRPAAFLGAPHRQSCHQADVEVS